MNRLTHFARLSPRSPTPDEDLAGELSMLGLDLSAEQWIRMGDGLAICVGGGSLLLGLGLAPVQFPLVFTIAALLAALSIEGMRTGPTLLAAAVRRRALGTAPWLVCRAAMRLRVTPTVEAAAAFAARDPTTTMDRALAASVRRARGTPDTGFEFFLDRWGDRFPPLRRGVRLLSDAATAPESDRERGIDRALSAVLDGVRERADDDAVSLSGPVTAVYAFGVLVPLAFVAALPAAGVAGVPISIPGIIAIYDFILPVGLLVAGVWLVSKRPVGFPATPVPATHPDVPDSPRRAIVAGVVAGLFAWFVAGHVLASWTPPIAAVGGGLGTALTLHYRPARKVRADVRDIEDGLPDVLYGIGRRVRDGTPVERALEATAASLDTPASRRFGDANARAERLGIGIEAALVGEYGTLDSVPSVRTDDVARLIADATHSGRPAGSALVAAGDHLAEFMRVERATRRSIHSATNTMGNTAALFGPLVGGVTVALAGRVGGSQLGSAIPQAELALAVGGYVLVLAVLLTALATGLARGFDRALVGYRVGLAVLGATGTYLAAVVAGSLLV